jgi:hypothetical protein
MGCPPDARVFVFPPMKYNIIISQPKAIEWKLNLSEAAIFSFLYELPSWAEHRIVSPGHPEYFCSKNKIIEQFPLLTGKRDTVYRLLKSLEEKDLIQHIFEDGKDWIKLTKKAMTYNDWEGSEKNPREPRKKIRGGSENNPTNTSFIDNTISNASSVRQKKIDFTLLLLEWEKDNPSKYPKLMFIQFVKYWIETSKNAKKIRYEKEQFFEIGKRLATWFSRTSDKEIVNGWEQEEKLDPLNVLLRTLFN